jgi:hypothetical protein
MSSPTYFVPTDARGAQLYGGEVTEWPLPAQDDGVEATPGAFVEPGAGTKLELLDLDGLLDSLGERIFVAEQSGQPGPNGLAQARLVAETSWSIHGAARFALECAEHVLADPHGTKLPSGASLADILGAAHRYLDGSGSDEGELGLLQRVSRLATARRLRQQSSEVADMAFDVTVEDEAQDLDALDDPAWSALASVRDAVLSAVEAIRHDALPWLFDVENKRYGSEFDATGSEIVGTPWGSYLGNRRTGVIPAWTAARDAAERARQALADANGDGAGATERAWQRARLEVALGL